ncbi:protein of unknown function (plasmid) [Cupriavidus neocaledonicus]|uniref:Uncharacterized protein n=1 Tax=Cupriavidus neocaledonicus TaxID=1040979 RepID=A0A375HPN1_9BURK|nr:hypothetical protein CBM2605_B170124 [Cupriavidus neocaledonicus]SPD58710.1 protein of unknown function [Cupriavidus neocaledonicus]
MGRLRLRCARSLSQIYVSAQSASLRSHGAVAEEPKGLSPPACLLPLPLAGEGRG